METAIKKAIEGGYKGQLPWCQECAEDYYRLLLDPLFWQALGKAEGWGKTKEEEGEMKGESLLSMWPYEWQVYWHCFIDHLAQGKHIDSFFINLLK